MRFRPAMMAIPFAVMISAAPAVAYTLKLDFDVDRNPATIDTVSASYGAEVSIQVWPDYPGELIEQVSFTAGGSCTECIAWNYFRLTVSSDIFRSGCRATGTDFGTLCLGWTNLTPDCDFGTGMSRPYTLSTTAGANVVLNAPITLVRFDAAVADMEGPFCPESPRRLVVAAPSGARGIVLFDYASMPTADMAWGRVKATYR